MRPLDPICRKLVEACEAINRLDTEGAKAALAAFLRVRIEAARAGARSISVAAGCQ